VKTLVDTNVLARLAQPAHSQHDTARRALESLRARDHVLCIVPQIIYEFWVVGTRSATENGLGLTLEEITTEVAQIKSLFRLFRDERAIFQAW